MFKSKKVKIELARTLVQQRLKADPAKLTTEELLDLVTYYLHFQDTGIRMPLLAKRALDIAINLGLASIEAHPINVIRISTTTPTGAVSIAKARKAAELNQAQTANNDGYRYYSTRQEAEPVAKASIDQILTQAIQFRFTGQSNIREFLAGKDFKTLLSGFSTKIDEYTAFRQFQAMCVQAIASLTNGNQYTLYLELEHTIAAHDDNAHATEPVFKLTVSKFMLWQQAFEQLQEIDRQELAIPATTTLIQYSTVATNQNSTIKATLKRILSVFLPGNNLQWGQNKTNPKQWFCCLKGISEINTATELVDKFLKLQPNFATAISRREIKEEERANRGARYIIIIDDIDPNLLEQAHDQLTTGTPKTSPTNMSKQ